MQGKLADMYTKLSASRAYLYTIARSTVAGNVTSRDCAGTILFLAENATQVCLDAIQVLGKQENKDHELTLRVVQFSWPNLKIQCFIELG
jgi:alkylation response protein AidB-like acyl-CoA dehydrogenase